MNGGATVFVVAGDVESRQAIGEIVESMGLATDSFVDGDDFFQSCRGACYGCVVTQRSENPIRITDFISEMVNHQIELPTIVIADHPQTSDTVQLMKHGAVTVLETPLEYEELRDAIAEAIEISNAEQSKRIERQIVLTRIASLSEGERKVLDMMIEGVANKVIAKRLKVSVRTVESRRHEVFAKMQVKSVAELVRTVVSSKSLTML